MRTNNETICIMAEEELRSYRLTSTEEPTDEMLHAIMEQVAEEARKSTQRAEASLQQMFEETVARIRMRKAMAS